MYAPAIHPNRKAEYKAFSFLDAEPVDMGLLIGDVLDAQEAKRKQEEAHRHQQLRQAQANRLLRRGEGGDVLALIQQFNESTDIATELAAAGFLQKDKRWIAPTSKSGVPGVTILAEGRKAWSFHEGDPLNDGHPHDAWDIAVAYRFQGDREAAVRALREGKL